MSRWQTLFDRFRPPRAQPVGLPTIADLRGRTYATYTATGVRVDLDRYFSTPEGKQAWAKVVESSRPPPSARR